MWTVSEGDRQYFYGCSASQNVPLATTYGSHVTSLSPVVELKVEMHSQRSRNVIIKKLWKLKGVTAVDVDLYSKKVTVTGNVTPAEVLKQVKKTGRKAEFWSDDTLHTSALAYTPGYSTAGYSSPGFSALSYTTNY